MTGSLFKYSTNVYTFGHLTQFQQSGCGSVNTACVNGLDGTLIKINRIVLAVFKISMLAGTITNNTNIIKFNYPFIPYAIFTGIGVTNLASDTNKVVDLWINTEGNVRQVHNSTMGDTSKVWYMNFTLIYNT